MDRRTLLLLALAAAMPVRARTAKPAPAPGLESVLVPAGMGVLALRVARCWVQTGVGVEGDHAMQTLTRSTRSFEQAFAGLRTIAPRVGQGEAVLLVEQRWRVYRMAWAARPDITVARRVLSLSDDLFALCERVADAAAHHLGGEPAALAAKAVHAEALVERMMRLALSRRWGTGPADLPLELERHRKEFPVLLAGLLTAYASNPAASGDIRLAQQQWSFFDTVLGSTESPKAPESVVRLGTRTADALASLATHIA